MPLTCLSTAVSKVVNKLCDCFIKKATHLFNSGRNVRALETKAPTFAGIKDDAQEQLRTGLRNGMVETKEARACLKKANKDITDEEANRKRYKERCKIFGWCAPNCWSTYKIGKKAAETLVEFNWSRDNKPTTITTEPPPQAVVHIPVDSVSLKASQDHILKEALQYIKGDDATVGLIVMWGPRGVGKTLLLQKINNSFSASTDTRGGPNNHPSTSEQTEGDIVNHGTSSSEIIDEAANTTARSDRPESPFDFVIYVTTSGNCTVGNIQSEILRRLNMKVPDSETTRATRISNFLKDKSFLVLLDGHDNDVDLAEVGLPHPLGVVHGQLKRKVVITTRKQTLYSYKMKVKDINVPGLKKGEALELFKESAGGKNNVYSNPNISEQMEELVDILKALPTELIKFGRDMREKGGPRQWKDVIFVVKELIRIQDREAISLREGIVKRLTEYMEKLRGEKEDVGNEIKLAKTKGMVATAKAQKWLARAPTIISDGTDIVQSEPTEPNWDISITAAKLRELQGCLNDRPSDITQPPSVVHISVDVVDLQPSRDCILNQALRCIKDDATVGLIGLWGPRQVGKTLVLKMINNSFETGNSGDPSFDFVIYLPFSEQRSVQSIQSGIIQRLKMTDDDDTEISRATRIFEFLKDKSFLVLLDGLQTYQDLAEVGLPPLGVQGQLKRKVVVTTRSRGLYSQMSGSRDMRVSGLGLDEALQLFQKTVGCENLYSIPRIGKHAEDIVEELRSRPSELIKFGNQLSGLQDQTQREDAILNKKKYWQQPSMAQKFKEAMEYVKDKPVNVIGIWGPGGVGKTHLLQKIKDQANSLFDHVIFVTASKECSVKKIQDQIVQDHKLAEASSVQNQAKIISRFLKGKGFILLLDDVWNQIDLEAVGIPYPLGSVAQHTRKVVLTARDKKVFGPMEVRKEIDVACLPRDEAWQLFQDMVGQETLSSDPLIEDLAKQLAKELKGLPLALITVGNAMYRKSKPIQWESAIRYMRRSCCDGDDQNLEMENVFKQIRFSYDSLRNDTLRECLLTCSLWPEDKEILTGDLIRCWIGLGLVDDCENIHASYRKGHFIIDELTDACLIESYQTSFHNAHYIVSRRDLTHRVMPGEASVKMHDVIRDMAIWISCGSDENKDNKDKWVVRPGVGANLVGRTIPWNIAECISLMSNNIKELPPDCKDSCSVKLKNLYLQENSLDEKIFGAIQSFTELTYIDLSRNNLTVIPEV